MKSDWQFTWNSFKSNDAFFIPSEHKLPKIAAQEFSVQSMHSISVKNFEIKIKHNFCFNLQLILISTQN
jgi:hypothetical protein